MKSLNFPISKRALTQLPPETDKMWDWVKTKYAQRVLAEMQRPFLSKQKAEKIAMSLDMKASQIGSLAHSGELYRLRSLAHEMEFIKEHGLEQINAYEIWRGNILDIQLKLQTREKNLKITEESPVWGVNIYGEGDLKHGAILQERMPLSKAIIYLSDELRKIAAKAGKNYLDDEQLVELNVVKQKALRDSKGRPPLLSLSAGEDIPIDTRKWNFYGIDKFVLPSEITLSILETSDRSIHGEWIEEELKIVIYVMPEELKPDSIQEYSLNQLRLKNTLFHEIRHMLQTLINKSKNIEHGGLPKYKTPGFDPLGYKPEFKYLEKKRVQDMTLEDVKNLVEREKTRLPHARRAIEYHTRLGDSVTEFNQKKLKFPKSDWERALKTYVGLSSYPVFKGDSFEAIIQTGELFRELKKDMKQKKEILERTTEFLNWRNIPDEHFTKLLRKTKEYKEYQAAKNIYHTAVKQFVKEVQ